MAMVTTKKLIEVALPLEAINRESARERSVRRGHPSKLHLWWSRKPLAICRAVIFASLIDDPDQPGVSPELLTEIDRLPLPRAAGLDWQSLSAGEQRRQKLFAFIERLITWEHGNDDAVLMTAQQLIHAATGGDPPPVYDPFSGGGSIPLEAQRLGLSSSASDLNPVAVLITKALIELPVPFVDLPPINRGNRDEEIENSRQGDALQDVDCLAEGDGSGARNLSLGADAATRRDVRDALTDHAGSGVDPSQYCGGLDSRVREGESPVSRHRSGLAGRTGDSPDSLRGSGLVPATRDDPTAQPARRSGTDADDHATTAKSRVGNSKEEVGNSEILYQTPISSRLPSISYKGALGLAADVRYYGQWIRDEAERRIGHLYPRVEAFLDHSDGTLLSASDAASRYPHLNLADYHSISSLLSPISLPVLAWLWARTARCPNPACGAQMPLVNSFTISARKGRTAWAEPVVDQAARTVQFVVRHTAPPSLEGTVGRNGVRCLVCGHTSPLQYVRSEGQAGRLGEQLMAIVAAYQEDRVFLSPDHRTVIAEDLQPSWRPDSDMARNPRHMTPPLYGMMTFDRLFSPRQLLALTTFSDLIRAVRRQILDDAARSGDRDSEAYMRAIVTYLALALDKAANVWSSLTSWKSDDGVVRGTFARQALAIVWVYAEANPFGTTSESFERAVASVSEVLDSLVVRRPGCAEQRDATSLNLAAPHLFATDPPYYDNIPYADLSDYFYVWLRHALGDLYPDLMSTLLVPKAAELVADPIRHGGADQARHYFEAGMRKVFTAIHQHQHANYPLTLFYAYKQAEQRSDTTASTGWETLLESLIGSNVTITGTWPMRTERAGRLRETDSNALASSIVLTCRPRPADALAATRREFLHALKSELPQALRRLQQGNIAPVDLAQAAIGPGIAIFSRYNVIIETDGTPMTVRTALQMINQEIDAVLAEQEGEFDATTRWALAWFDQYGVNEGPYGVAETLSKAKNTSVERMVEAGILAARSGKVRLLKGAELPDHARTANTSHVTVWEVTQQLVWSLEHGGEQPAAVLLSAAQELSGAARDLAYRLYTICERRRWPQEALAYNSLVVAWPEISRQAARYYRETMVHPPIDR